MEASSHSHSLSLGLSLSHERGKEGEEGKFKNSKAIKFNCEPICIRVQKCKRNASNSIWPHTREKQEVEAEKGSREISSE